MKFAKELDQELVPEWRAKYFDYKGAKKKIKAVTKARSKFLSTPKSGPRTPGSRRSRLPFGRSPRASPSALPPSSAQPTPESVSNNDNNTGSGKRTKSSGESVLPQIDRPGETSRLDEPQTRRRSSITERSPLRNGAAEGSESNGYGSIAPDAQPEGTPRAVVPPPLKLPGPAIKPSFQDLQSQPKSKIQRIQSRRSASLPVSSLNSPSAEPSSRVGKRMPRLRDLNLPSPTSPFGGSSARSQFLKRMFSGAGEDTTDSAEIPLENYREYDFKQAEYFTFLDKELEKIESFYKQKEGEATRRLEALEQQLQEMRGRRNKEIAAFEAKKSQNHGEWKPQILGKKHFSNGGSLLTSNGSNSEADEIYREAQINRRTEQRNSRELSQIKEDQHCVDPDPRAAQDDSRRDFTRRLADHTVPHRVAKRKLKVALQEFYRGLELLKSYALLNRTAFRKITKKHDKTVKARPTGRYMTEKVNTAHFVKSQVLDSHIVAIEDLYADYFEKGNHKVAINKLRSKLARHTYCGSTFRNGLLLAAGFVLGIQGLFYAGGLIVSGDQILSIQTNFLLQLYAGYFLALTLFLLFCLDCRVWVKSKINYTFVFEFDTRHNLDWRQLAELPCLLWFFEGLTVWLNFHPWTPGSAFLYWPIALVGITVLVLFLPAKLAYFRSRLWWAYSNFRLLLAGLYPVEFRDFFLGDMYCSMSYAMGNIEIFFCLYATSWANPSQCNSSHSRLLGFFSCLPGIWRALQCLRRYYDTRNVFPHLANCGKYACTILFYVSLSLWRIDQSQGLKALFIFFGTVNSVYVSVWDLAMDWSLGNPYAEKPFLRSVLGYKYVWPYYFAMIIDPILRFNWVFYIAFTEEIQHSALLSFFISFSEIGRRALWTLFRVENEHCTNVGRFRASRDMPLPYDITTPRVSTSSGAPSIQESSRAGPSASLETSNALQATSTRTDIERATSREAPNEENAPQLRRRRTLATTEESPVTRGLMRVGTILAEAHRQDFERKRRQSVASLDRKGEDRTESGDSSDEDDEAEVIARHQSGPSGHQANR